MKQTHRKFHGLIWLLLLPALLGFVYWAQTSGPAEFPTMEAAPNPSTAGELQ